jgi:hypothetical protein
MTEPAKNKFHLCARQLPSPPLTSERQDTGEPFGDDARHGQTDHWHGPDIRSFLDRFPDPLL